MDLDKKIEAILFHKGERISIKKLASFTNTKESEVKQALDDLENRLVGTSGLRLMRKDNEIMLGTAPETSAIIESLIKDELNKDLGKAGQETLAIVMYLGPIVRSRIDYIRGVNSAFILRALSIRGLVEKVSNPNDKRTFLYQPTFDLLSHLGITKVGDLPEYEQVRKEINIFENTQEQKEESSESKESE